VLFCSYLFSYSKSDGYCCNLDIIGNASVKSIRCHSDQRRLQPSDSSTECHHHRLFRTAFTSIPLLPFYIYARNGKALLLLTIDPFDKLTANTNSLKIVSCVKLGNKSLVFNVCLVKLFLLFWRLTFSWNKKKLSHIFVGVLAQSAPPVTIKKIEPRSSKNYEHVTDRHSKI
jgi:hypothetical protein